jgi:hypothetical protein
MLQPHWQWMAMDVNPIDGLSRLLELKKECRIDL